VSQSHFYIQIFRIYHRMSEILLASASPRRRELLDLIGIKYISQAMDIDETVKEDEAPADYVLRLAREKALAGLNQFSDKVVLAADTTVVIDGKILGKPENEQDAAQMLRALSGSRHQVLTAIACARREHDAVQVEADVVVTDVCFASLSEQQIEAYIRTGEPMDKAGAYGIQGKAALFVERIEGSYSNVVGLPLAETGKLLERFGIALWQ
jgi:septum formation protein